MHDGYHPISHGPLRDPAPLYSTEATKTRMCSHCKALKYRAGTTADTGRTLPDSCFYTGGYKALRGLHTDSGTILELLSHSMSLTEIHIADFSFLIGEHAQRLLTSCP